MRSAPGLILLSFCALALSIAGSASAQTTAPAVPTVMPAPNCQKPGAAPSSAPSELGKAAAESKRTNWIRDQKAYLECIRAFVTDHQAQAATHAAAANSGVEEYNKGVKALNEQIDVKQ